MRKRISAAMSAAINHIYDAIKPWEITQSQRTRLEMAQKGNAGALCDLFAELGMTEDAEVQEFYAELDGQGDDTDEIPASNDDDETKIRDVMSLLGKRTSPSKAETARENGKKGGRPRKDGKGREKAK